MDILLRLLIFFFLKYDSLVASLIKDESIFFEIKYLYIEFELIFFILNVCMPDKKLIFS